MDESSDVSFDDDAVNETIVHPTPPDKWNFTDRLQEWKLADTPKQAEWRLLIVAIVLFIFSLLIILFFLIPHKPKTEIIPLTPLIAAP